MGLSVLICKMAMKNRFLGFGGSDEWGCDTQAMGTATLQSDAQGQVGVQDLVPQTWVQITIHFVTCPGVSE